MTSADQNIPIISPDLSLDGLQKFVQEDPQGLLRWISGLQNCTAATPQTPVTPNPFDINQFGQALTQSFAQALHASIPVAPPKRDTNIVKIPLYKGDPEGLTRF